MGREGGEGEGERKKGELDCISLCVLEEGNRRSDFFLSFNNNFVIRIIELKKRQWDCGKLFSIGYAGKLHSTKII